MSSRTEQEIAQQPQLWEQVARDAQAGESADRAFLEPVLARPGLRIVLTGAGTSSYAGSVLAPALARRLRRRVDAVSTTDAVSDPRAAFAEDVPTLLVSFARSGDSPESVAVTELADALVSEVHHLVVTCNPDGALARDHAARERSLVVLMPERANDRGFAMTSSFTCMTLAVWLRLAGADGAGTADVARLASAARSVLDEQRTAIRALVAGGRDRLVYLGSGPLHGLARESALKALELTAGATTTTGESSTGFRHGPKAVLTPGTLAVVYLSDDPYVRSYDLDIVRELAGSVADVLVVGVLDEDDLPEHVGRCPLPGLADVDDAELALPAVVVAQLVGLELSLAHGLEPDNPFPGGEVNRVVQGVTVHPLEPVPGVR